MEDGGERPQPQPEEVEEMSELDAVDPLKRGPEEDLPGADPVVAPIPPG